MSGAQPSINLTTQLSRRLWAEAVDEVADDMPINDPERDQILTWLMASYLDVDLGVGGKHAHVYHRSRACPGYPDNERFVDIERGRRCGTCLERFGGPTDPEIFSRGVGD